MSPGSLTAAYRAAGAVADAVRAVAAGDAGQAFCAVRPPGHHAGPNFAMGFCLLSNLAIGARVAQACGLRRVAVADFDVHHGNGTQAVFEADADVFFASVHESPAYPAPAPRARSASATSPTRSVPRHGAAGGQWRAAFEGLAERVDGFAPDLILVSAGFDAHARDPLADQATGGGGLRPGRRGALAAAARSRTAGAGLCPRSRAATT